MIEIRKYKPEDREYVRKICMDTAKKGYNKNPRKRECIANMFIDYNIECEPENCFVAVEDDIPCGYMVCYTNRELFEEKMKKVYIPKIMKKSVVLGLFTKICVATNKKLYKQFGGGEFHINIDEKYQGKKIGPKLMTAMALHLRNNSQKYMYLVTQNRKTRGYGFYMHYGFFEAKKCGAGTLCLAYDVAKIDEKL